MREKDPLDAKSVETLSVWSARVVKIAASGFFVPSFQYSKPKVVLNELILGRAEIVNCLPFSME